jgi:hypothetical protein
LVLVAEQVALEQTVQQVQPLFLTILHQQVGALVRVTQQVPLVIVVLVVLVVVPLVITQLNQVEKVILHLQAHHKVITVAAQEP